MKSFRQLENILRFSLKVRGNTGNISVQLNVAELQVEKRCWSYYHPLETSPLSNIFLLRVEINLLKINWCQFNLLRNMLLQLVTTKFLCVAIFEVGGNTARSTTLLNFQRNNVPFASFSNLLLVLLHSNAVRAFARNVRFRYPDIGSASNLCIFFPISALPTRRTPNVYCTYWELFLYVEGQNRGLDAILTAETI